MLNMNDLLSLHQKCLVCSDNEAVERLVRDIFSMQTGLTVVSFLNARAVVLSLNSANFHQALMSSKFLLRDGIGVELGLKLLGLPCGVNLNGTDFIPKLLEHAKNRNMSVILLGSTISTVSRCKQILERAGVTVVYACDGFQKAEFYGEKIKEFAGNEECLVVCGMGMPKQELVSAFLAQRLGHNLIFVNGGAILDFISGTSTRAPKFVRKMKMEFLFRLFREPRRMWRRTFIEAPLYIVLVLRKSVELKFSKKL